MQTNAATRTTEAAHYLSAGAYSRAELLATGCTRSQITARIDARRWQAVGRAIVLHNSELTREQRWRAGVINCGPRAALASFSAAESVGLVGWERDEIHVLAPVGVPDPRVPGLSVILHRTRTPIRAPGGCQQIAPALVLAARSFRSARPACGLLAAGVQQRMTSAAGLEAAIRVAPHGRHQRALVAATRDIAMGAEALSEIDFARLCRRHRLPAPTRQALRIEPSGRRRYLDAEWQLRDGRRVAVEVDGAVHLAPRKWFNDQLRQNELALSGALVLRFPSVIVRTEPLLVVGQLRRALATQ